MKKEEISINSLKEGESKIISKYNNQYVITEINKDNPILNKEVGEKITASVMLEKYFESSGVDMSTYNFQGQNFMSFTGEEGYYGYSQRFGKVDLETVSRLAENCQNNIDQIRQINSIIAYYVNVDDLFGRVIETLENNTNKSFNVKDNIRTTSKIHNCMVDFCQQINLPLVIEETCKNTFLEGTFIMYLLGDSKVGWHVSFYPLGIVEITDIEIGHEPLVTFNVDKLRSKIQNSLNKHLDNEQIKEIEAKMDLQIKLNYPPEVYEGYKNNKHSVVLNQERIGVVRINRGRDGKYGVSPALKSLKSEIMLETIDRVDRKNLIDRAKKIYAQTMRKELLEESDQPLEISSLAGLSQQMFNYAMMQKDAIYTAPPYVESISIIEPKVELTSSDKIEEYRNRVLNALGISFITGENGNSFTIANLNYSELLKTINKIVKQLQPIMNKYFKVVALENKMPLAKVPTLEIASSELINLESKISLINTYYSTLGLSRETVFKILDIDLETEMKRREDENNKKLNEIFSPYATSFNTNVAGNEETQKETEDTNGNGSKKSEDRDKSNSDKERNLDNKKIASVKGGEIDE